MKYTIYISLMFISISFLFGACSNTQKLACPKLKSNEKQHIFVVKKKKKAKKKQHKESYATTHNKKEKTKERVLFLAQKNKEKLHKTAVLESKPKKEIGENPTFANSDNDNLAATIVESEKSFLEKISTTKQKETKPQMSPTFDKVMKKNKIIKNTSNRRFDEGEDADLLNFILLAAILAALFLILSYVVTILLVGDLLSNLAFLLMFFVFSTITIIFTFRKYRQNKQQKTL